ncbi:MAG: ABC transporter permease [Nitratiruptor sp.]|nr:ABC transporter permease [Nitratiruptor sp.]NPA83096.1 ABC transporter permease [Campylobacterota bacterium]
MVIVILGILAAIAVPKLWVTRDDAIIAKGRNDVAAIRSAIMTVKHMRILRGLSPYPDTLDDAQANSEGEELFKGSDEYPLLSYPIYSKDEVGHWMKTGDRSYKYILSQGEVAFTYDNQTGKFDCDHSDEGCQLLTQ